MASDLRFDLEPKKALEHFRAKGYATSFAWQDTWQQEHDSAFTVAKMVQLDLLKDTKAAVDKAIAAGQTLAQFRDALEPRLMEAGWWGKATMTDPITGEDKLVQLGSPRRLRTIFETNLKTAYAAGHWQEIQDAKAGAPFLMYDAVLDDATRDEHAAWDGTVLPVDDAWWDTHMPPNGWNCRCGVVQLSAEQAREMGYESGDKAPAVQTREYVSPRTGEVSQVPLGVDPGWAYNPGASRPAQVATQLLDKAAAAEPADGAAVFRTLTAPELAALDEAHASWVGEVMSTPADAPRSSWRVVGGLSDEDLRFLDARGTPARSAAITLESRLMRGPKADRHEAAGNALTRKDWESLPAALRDVAAVLIDRESGELHYVLRGSGGTSPRLVVAVGHAMKGKTVNSVRSAFRLNVQALRDRTRFELIRGEL